jgi:hypothetical protein
MILRVQDKLVTHARDNWWTLDFANAFVSPGVNSRGELVPSHGASRRRLGDKLIDYLFIICDIFHSQNMSMLRSALSEVGGWVQVMCGNMNMDVAPKYKSPLNEKARLAN